MCWGGGAEGEADFLIIIYYWASEASPTLGCSIEISSDIIGRYVSYVKLTA